MRSRSEDVDDFGLDPVPRQGFCPSSSFSTKIFGVETTGAEHIPSEGRCLIVANHSGTSPTTA